MTECALKQLQAYKNWSFHGDWFQWNFLRLWTAIPLSLRDGQRFFHTCPGRP